MKMLAVFTDSGAPVTQMVSMSRSYGFLERMLIRSCSGDGCLQGREEITDVSCPMILLPSHRLLHLLGRSNKNAISESYMQC
jgi:hypothetical protein